MYDATDRKFMKAAIDLAKKGLGLASPNPSVGCVIARNGRIVGHGMHVYASMDHAEVVALNEAAAQSNGATAYVTLEPCSHQGRTPPCADKLIRAGIRRVVVATVDPNPKVSGRGIRRLRSSGIEVDVGPMAAEAAEMIEPFACHITTGWPLVTCKVGMSLDGKIGTGRPEGRRISSAGGREFGQNLRLKADALLVGVDTILADDPDLTYRGRKPKARPLTRVILDSHLRTPLSARLFRSESQAPVLIFCGRKASKDRRRKLERLGAEIIPVALGNDGLNLRSVLRELGKKNVLELLVEGGSRVHWSFLSRRLVDKFYFIVSPLVLGGKDSVSSVGGTGFKGVKDAAKFKIREVFLAGSEMILEGYPSFSRSIISPWLSQETAAFDARYPRFPSTRK